MFNTTSIRPATRALFAFALALGLALAGCGAAQQQTAAETSAEPLPQSATCPVMKNTFKPDANTKRTVWKGKTYYFCCPGCDKKFADAPESFLNADGEPAAEGGADEAGH